MFERLKMVELLPIYKDFSFWFEKLLIFHQCLSVFFLLLSSNIFLFTFCLFLLSLMAISIMLSSLFVLNCISVNAFFFF